MKKYCMFKAEMRRNMLELQNIGYAVEEGKYKKRDFKEYQLKDR